MQPNQRAVSIRKSYLKKLTLEARDACFFMSDENTALRVVNKALYYGEDHEWLVNSAGVTAKMKNSYSVLVRRNAFYRQLVLLRQEDRKQRIEEDWDFRKRVEQNRKALGLSNRADFFGAF